MTYHCITLKFLRDQQATRCLGSAFTISCRHGTSFFVCFCLPSAGLAVDVQGCQAANRPGDPDFGLVWVSF